MATMAPRRISYDYRPYGNSQRVFVMHDPEVVLSGPAGTGKSRALLEKLHLCMLKYDGARGLMARKTRSSLTQTAMVTFKEKVRWQLDDVIFHGGDQEYRYPNGSRIIVGGLDDPQKIMSAEYDIAYVQEATELIERDWEAITTRLRNGVMPYQQILGDCNPDSNLHWLKVRSERVHKQNTNPVTRMLETEHEDNPTLYDVETQTWTERGKSYIAKLDQLTGVRYYRLRKGLWVGAEGMVYENWDRKINLVDPFDVPRDWRRIRSIDFGYTNPFVCQWWAIDPDGRMYLYREIYQSQQLVEDMAKYIIALTGEEKIEVTIADHDAEDRATLARHKVHTQPANKEVEIGIQAVQDYIRKAGDDKPRLYIMRGCTVALDHELVDAGRPTSTEQEIEGYIWQEYKAGKPVKEEPLKVNDHGMDCARYATMYINTGPEGLVAYMRKRKAEMDEKAARKAQGLSV